MRHPVENEEVEREWNACTASLLREERILERSKLKWNAKNRMQNEWKSHLLQFALNYLHRAMSSLHWIRHLSKRRRDWFRWIRCVLFQLFQHSSALFLYSISFLLSIPSSSSSFSNQWKSKRGSESFDFERELDSPSCQMFYTSWHEGLLKVTFKRCETSPSFYSCVLCRKIEGVNQEK